MRSQSIPLYNPATGLIRIIKAGMGSCDVMQGTQQVATILDAQSDKVSALYIDSGVLSRPESEQILGMLQPHYSGRLAFIPNPATW